jgi:2-amino-4-hydroxy-6-hydroxymethyldihydropteridine diphosphokinase
MATAYIALGANLGDRAGALRAATEALSAAGVRVAAESPVYETDAVAETAQPAYLNAVLRVETALPPDELLALCLTIERRLGRIRPPGEKKAPRVIDLDLLLWGDLQVARPGLTLPHPALLDRPFVRIPLADVAVPGLRHPVTGDGLDRAAPDPGVRRT